MATKRQMLDDPNSCLNKAADNEPIFVLRAKDILAAGLIYGWAAQAEALGTSPRKCVEARMTALDMERWGERKIPT